MRLVLAPSNLGLSPLRAGHQPGAWRAPAALLDSGLLPALGSPDTVRLPRPAWRPDAQPGTGLRNGYGMRDFNLALADVVHDAARQGEFALVVGGDCSILLGALAGARRAGAVSLVHVDGHSDFRHPGNHDPGRGASGVAGMDLALATGRGEALGTRWPGIDGSLVRDADVIQIGERESRDADFAFADLDLTVIERIDVYEAAAIGVVATGARIAGVLDRQPARRFWIHLDLDVLDQSEMPAVDCPGTPGIASRDVLALLGPLVAEPGCLGLTVTNLDPDLDPDGRHAALVVSLLGRLPFRA